MLKEEEEHGREGRKGKKDGNLERARKVSGEEKKFSFSKEGRQVTTPFASSEAETRHRGDDVLHESALGGECDRPCGQVRSKQKLRDAFHWWLDREDWFYSKKKGKTEEEKGGKRGVWPGQVGAEETEQRPLGANFQASATTVGQARHKQTPAFQLRESGVKLLSAPI